MYQQETRLSSSSHHSIMTTRVWVRKEITNLKSSCKIMSLKVGFDVQDKLLRECTCTRSKLLWHFKLLLNFIDVVCVNACVLWMLKYPDWQERKNHRRHLYLLSLGEILVMADSGNVDILRATRARDVRCKQPSSPATVKKGGGRWLVRRSNCPTATDRRTVWKNLQCSEWVCKNHIVKTIPTKCENVQQQSDKFHSHFCSQLYLLVLKNYVFHSE